MLSVFAIKDKLLFYNNLFATLWGRTVKDLGDLVGDIVEQQHHMRQVSELLFAVTERLTVV